MKIYEVHNLGGIIIFNFTQLLDWVTTLSIHNHPNQSIEFTNVHFDSRKIKHNSVFFALTTGVTDGHLHIKNAIKNGATAIVCSDENYILQESSVPFILVSDTLISLQELASKYRLFKNKLVIAITGSNGKTTTKDMISHVLSTNFKVHKTEGNYNNHIGVPYTILNAPNDADIWVLEMGMNHAGEIDLLGKIAKPDIAVITNIGEAHLEFLGSRQNIAHAKGELLSHLKSGGLCLLPSNSEFKDILKNKTTEKTLFYGLNDVTNEDSITASSIVSNENNSSFLYSHKSFDGSLLNKFDFTFPYLGEHNISNVLSAIYIAEYLNINFDLVSSALKNLKISPMRFEKIEGENGVIIINDAYNASPTSMKASIETFIPSFNDKKRILVLGDMFELGDNTVEMHIEIGKFLNKYMDQISILITVGVASKLISSAYKGKYRHFDSKDEAKKFISYFYSNDFALLLKASRGMRLEELI